MLRFLVRACTAMLAGSPVACRDGPMLPARSWTGRIHGTVINQHGGRVPNAAITLRSLSLGYGSDTLGACVGQRLSPQSLVADARGDYSYTWHGTVIPAYVCLAVDAVATGFPGELAGTTHVDSINLHPTMIDDLQIIVKVRPR